jgi:segregation and condensation protein B
MANELLKAQIEAALFLTEKPLRAQAVAGIVNAEVNLVRQLILELIRDYENRNGGLEVSDDDGYIIQVKDEYTNLVDEFVPIDMPTALIRTLSAIAIKQPVMQSEVIKLRGAGAYDHIKDLLARELIAKREEGGRSPILTTTKKFQEYFRLSKDGKSFRQQMNDELKGTPTIADDTAADVAVTVPADVPATVVADVPAAVVEAAADVVAEAHADAVASTPDVAATVAIDVLTEVTAAKAKEIHTFDASPDPDTPPIGSAVESTADDAGIDLDKVILEDTDTDAIAKMGETVDADAFN